MREQSLSNNRVYSIDILRGIVMIIMALDHTRDYFSNFYHDPTDLAFTTPAMFFTRWITHYCAPVFIFLAGTSAYLSLSKKQDKKGVSFFLLKRGIWLIILELTIVRFGWLFNVDYTQTVVQVIWAIGWSMIFLAGLIHLPFSAILAIALVMIFGHNLLDGITVAGLGQDGMWWHFIHEFGPVSNGQYTLLVIYPIVPWIGVMAAGYCFGRIMRYPPQQRNKLLYKIGGGAILLFVLLRAVNIYGDPHPWAVQQTPIMTVLSFLNCTKYPPSLLYLLMTLGPAIILMPVLEKMQNGVGRFFKVFGTVPLFYYILHIYLIHFMAMLGATMLNVPLDYFTETEKIFAPKPGWGYGLPGVYLAWAIAVLLLYYPCRWFMKVKQQHKKWWLSYI